MKESKAFVSLGAQVNWTGASGGLMENISLPIVLSPVSDGFSMCAGGSIKYSGEKTEFLLSCAVCITADKKTSIGIYLGNNLLSTMMFRNGKYVTASATGIYEFNTGDVLSIKCATRSWNVKFHTFSITLCGSDDSASQRPLPIIFAAVENFEKYPRFDSINHLIIATYSKTMNIFVFLHHMRSLVYAKKTINGLDYYDSTDATQLPKILLDTKVTLIFGGKNETFPIVDLLEYVGDYLRIVE